MKKVYMVAYTFCSFGLKELESKPQFRKFDSYQDYTYWITDLQHDKNLHNYTILEKAWMTEDQANLIKYGSFSA